MSAGTPVGGPFKAAVGFHESLSLEHLREARRVLASYCLASREYCARAKALVGEAARLAAKARFEDLLFDSKYQGLDAPLFALIRGLLDFYSRYISGLAAVAGESPIVQVTSPVEVADVKYEDGDIAVVPPERAYKLIACGAAKPLDSLLEALTRRA